MTPLLSRRRILMLGIGGFAAATLRAASAGRAGLWPPLPDFVGINTACFAQLQRATDPAKRVDPYDLPRLIRGELDVRILDLVSTMLGTREHGPLEKFRAEADRAGCIITNLKVNLPDLRYDSEEPSVRRHAIAEYKHWIDAAAVLGARWLRPFPAPKPPRWETLVAGFAELADYAAGRGITVLVENYQWLDREPDAIPRLVAALDGRIAAQPDTFNWIDDDTRRTGLAKAFPHALSCDFKVRDLGPNNEHPAYDLRACFDIGYRAGFRGPWCIEHVRPEREVLVRGLKWIADRLRAWTLEAGRA